jgi:hypothetical protein
VPVGEASGAGRMRYTFTGNPNAEVTTLTGNINGSGFTNQPWTMNR